MLILGIDPGFAIVGYGIINYVNNKYNVLEYGSITTDAGTPFNKRLLKIAEDLESIISRYKIDAVSIEELFFNNNVTTGIPVAEARGVILYILEKNNIKVYEYTPVQIKQSVTGSGRADKLQMKKMVKDYLKLATMPRLDDTTDALAAAVTHIHRYKYENIANENNSVTKLQMLEKEKPSYSSKVEKQIKEQMVKKTKYERLIKKMK